ncbi:hypothetical protein P5673_014985 [Acropora cervicornis]|uniref:Uncharacterized protein n=1 Tax=Acropora cervicornis TaxID=6130 RepID=A0AAD9V671_ACRCE|nr:hypothetical protein P5673_014985 [Acropora cervicornis]
MALDKVFNTVKLFVCPIDRVDHSYSCNVLMVSNILPFELPFIRTVSLPFGVLKEKQHPCLPWTILALSTI